MWLDTLRILRGLYVFFSNSIIVRYLRVQEEETMKRFHLRCGDFWICFFDYDMAFSVPLFARMTIAFSLPLFR